MQYSGNIDFKELKSELISMDKSINFVPREFWPSYYSPPPPPRSDFHKKTVFSTSYFIYLKYRTIKFKKIDKNILTIKMLSIKMVKLGFKKK